MRKMKDSGVEWIDTIPENWKVVPNESLVFIWKRTTYYKGQLD